MEPGTATDGSGVSWDVTALNETMIVIIFSVVVVTLLTLAKIARGDA